MPRQAKKAVRLSPESHGDLQDILRCFKRISPAPTKTLDQLSEIKSHAATFAADTGGARWFKNTTGGDFFVTYPPDECTKRGGTPVPGNCPHFFAAVSAANRLSKRLSGKRPKTRAKGKKTRPK